jgi:thymidylate synthase
MINIEENTVTAFDIGSAWREVMQLCVINGHDYEVKGGSYIGQIRRQLDSVRIRVTRPGHRPLAPIMPPSIPGPTSDDKISAYFERYLMSARRTENEDYTYGFYIANQIERLIGILNDSSGDTNQACISVGDVNSIFLDSPPCLRVVSFKVVSGVLSQRPQLNMTVYFRSWDLFAGLPDNLGGLQLLKEYVLEHLIFDCDDGFIIAYSDGLHIYSQYDNVVNMLCVEKIRR